MPRYIDAPHVENLLNNVEEINRLLEIHREVGGEGPGRKYNIQVLNKSCIVLLLACWESYVEDMAEAFYKEMLKSAGAPHVFPDHILGMVAKEVKKRDNSDFWNIYGVGWKGAFIEHEKKVMERYVEQGAFNTPSAQNVDKLMAELLGYTSFSSEWKWRGSSNDKCKYMLQKLIELRGDIAHRVQVSSPVYKHKVEFYRAFVFRLAVISHNRLVDYMESKTGHRVWKTYHYQKTR